MLKFFVPALLFSFLATAAIAQKTDSLFVSNKGEEWQLRHQARKGETVFLLARRYHVPPAMLADANGLGYQDALKENTTLRIPIGAYNLQNTKGGGSQDTRPLYYRVREEDNLYRISRQAGVPQRTIQVWNNMTDNNVTPGQTLQVGWLLYDATQMPAAGTVTSNTRPAQPSATQMVPPAPAQPQQPLHPDVPAPAITADTPLTDTVREISAVEQLYLDQTSNGQNVVTEKGTAAFFAAAKASNGVYYAFHNAAARGAIIKVHNPGTGKTVFVKVIGPLPGTKQYANALIGISGAARAALGVRDMRAWCVLSYAGY